MESNEQNRNRLIDTENRLTAVRGEGELKGWVKTVKGLSKKKNPQKLIDTDNSMVITTGKGRLGRWKRVKGE